MNFSTTFSRQQTWYLVCSQTHGVWCRECHRLHRVDALFLAAVQPVLCLPPLSPSLSPLCLLWLAPLSCPRCWWSGTLLWQGAPSSDTSGSLRSDCPAARAGQSLLHFSLALWMSLRYSSRGRGNVHAQRVTAPKSCSSINQRGF